MDKTGFKKFLPNVITIVAACAISCILTYTIVANNTGTVDKKVVKGDEAYSSIKSLVESETANYLKEKLAL